ncbi:MAG: endonuclease/exonuclease/phosphatase family protein [Candidatus Nomurabacteria bacterium]|nr:endonuclease/exonuclease/phosphatase family protein [Candidatus Nomurabacteria bacterium]
MKILTLNTQKAYQPDFKNFIVNVLNRGEYDFILLQEVTSSVSDMIKTASSEYQMINPFDPELGEHTHGCVLYKNLFTLQKELFVSFAILEPGFPRHGWGFTGGVFNYGGKRIFVGSAHLHPGLRKKRRMEQLKLVKEKVMAEFGAITVVFGGDFNFGMPGEISCSEKILSPEFVRVTKGLGPTLDSRYTEKTSWGVARIANILAKLGISIRLRADHVYIDSLTVKSAPVRCRIVPDRVSDHLAVEVSIG